MKTYYDILNISNDASQEEIVEAYNKLKFMYSENLVSSDLLYEGAETDLLEEIEAAYKTLSNITKRTEYNKLNNIRTKRDLVRYNFDVPLDIEKSVVEVPAFAKEEETNYTDILSKINKVRLTPKGIKKTKYKLDENKEELIQKEEEFSGEFLKFVREYKNISYEYIHSKTKISNSYIKAIEEDNFKELPAKVYLRSFLKSYLELLELDVNKAFNSYMSRYERTTSI